MSHKRIVLAAPLLFFACASATEPPLPMDGWRTELADPQTLPVRQGDSIDFERLKSSFDRARGENREALRAAFKKSVEALPLSDPPSETHYRTRLTFESDDPEARRSQAFTAALEANVTMTARFFVSQFLAVAMMEEAGTTADIALWLGFFYAARPQVSRCGVVPGGLSLCVDYGGRDVLEVEMVPDQELWVGRRLTWWTRREN
ncbi:MAG: hypothetical protein AAFQ82_25920 [Myxococcota bacterium]